MQKLLLKGSLALLAVTLLSGCAATGSGAPPTSPSNAATSEAVDAARVVNGYTLAPTKPGCERKAKEPPLSCGAAIKQGETKEISPGVTITLGAPESLVPDQTLPKPPEVKLVRIPLTIVNASASDYSIMGMDPVKLEDGVYSHMDLEPANNVVFPVDIDSANLTPDTYDLRPGATLKYNVGFYTTGKEFDLMLFDRYSRLSLTSHVIVPEA